MKYAVTVSETIQSNKWSKVIWQKTASPPRTDSSVVFAMWAHWRIRLNFASFGPPESTTQRAIRSVQPFLHSARQKVPTLYKHWIDPRSIEHSYVLSNAGLSNAVTETGICTSLKSDLYFGFHSPLNGKSVLLNFICTWDLVLICWKETAEIGIRTSLKSASYFRFVGKTMGVDATTFLSRMQNLVKIGKELWT